MTEQRSTNVVMTDAATATLRRLDSDQKASIAADLRKLTDPSATATAINIQAGDKRYTAQVLSNGWVAVYRDLKPTEPRAKPGQRTLVVMDLLAPDTLLQKAKDTST